VEYILKNPAIFYGGIVLAIVGIALGIFFLIPGINHVITDSSMHIKHAILCFGLAVIGIVGALVARPKAAMN
jgi:fumarate reductase subunit D